MSKVVPISQQAILTDRRLLKYPEVFGSLDRGCSLTKMLYVKKIPDQPDKASLELALFANVEFDGALDWLAARATEEGALGSPGRRFHVTGVGGEKYKAAIEKALGMEVLFADEFVSQQTGAHFLLSNFQDEQFCYPEHAECPGSAADMPEWLAAALKRVDLLFAENDAKRLPVIFGFCGSASVLSKLNEDGSFIVMGANWFGGKSFLGLSQLLLGTNSYDEIMALAAQGERRRVDTQAKEMMDQGAGSEYRMVPPETPLFPFGKASEWNPGSYRREDVAAAIVGAVTGTLMSQMASFARNSRVRKVYLGGNFFKAKVARDILLDFLGNTPSNRHLRIKFLSNGHTGCIGAIQVTPADVEEIRKKATFFQEQQQ